MTSSGPLTPGPKPSLSRSYACRSVVDVGELDGSVSPSPSFITGTVRRSISTIEPAARRPGRRATFWPHRSHSTLCPSVGRLSRPMRRRSMRSPHSPSRAGRSVIEASTATTTTIAAAWPSTVTSESPETNSDSRAMTTVPPANATALPEVAAACPMASCTLMPSWRAERARVTMNSA